MLPRPCLLLLALSWSSASAQSDSAADRKLVGDYRPQASFDTSTKARSIVFEVARDTGGHHAEIRSACFLPSGGNASGSIETATITKRVQASDTLYVLSLGYTGVQRLVPRGGIQFSADSTIVQLVEPSDEHPRDAQPGSTVKEAWNYRIDRAKIRQLAKAKVLIARVQGSEGRCDMAFQPGTQARLRQFIQHELPAS